MTRHLLPFFILSYFVFTNILAQPQWMNFHASDGVDQMLIDDGFLYVGAGSGLSKINIATGDKTVYSSLNSEIPSNIFDEIEIDAAGNIWIGRFGDGFLSSFDGDNWHHWQQINGDSVTTVYDIKAHAGGTVWMALRTDNNNGPSIYKYGNGIFEELLPPADLPFFYIGTLTAIEVAPNGHFWTIVRDSSNQVFQIAEYDGNDWTLHDVSSLAGQFLNAGDKIISDSQNNIYYAKVTAGGNNFLKYDGQTWTTANAPTLLNQSRPVYRDDNDNIWISQRDNNLLKYDGQAWEVIDLATIGLSGGYPQNFRIDGNGHWWIGYANDNNSFDPVSLYKYDGSNLHLINLSNSRLPTNFLRTIITDKLNNKWITGHAEYVKFDGNTWQNIPKPFLLNDDAYPVGSNAAGDLWLEFSWSSAIMRYDGVVFTAMEIVDQNGVQYDRVTDLHIGSDDRMYVGVIQDEILVIENGNTTYLDGITAHVFGSLQPDAAEFIEVDTSGAIWVAGWNALHKHNGTEWEEIPYLSNHPINNGMWIAPDQKIWLHQGIILPGGSGGFNIYNGVDWETMAAPVGAIPHWDSHGNIWLGSQSGLYKYDGTDWIHFTSGNSPLPDNWIDGIHVDEYDNVWIATRFAGLSVFNEIGIQNILAESLPKISGHIYRDLNSNDQLDPGDLPMAFQKTLLLPDSIITFSNFDGSYRYALPAGEYDVSYAPIPNWLIDNTPITYNVDLQNQDIDGLDFRVLPIEEIHDLELVLDGGFPRCNREVYYYLTYRNEGTTNEGAEIRFHPDELTFVASSNPPPDSYDGDTLVWTHPDLLPHSFNQIRVSLNMPDETYTDSTLTFHYSIDREANGQSVRMKTGVLEQVVACAYDPNDKLVHFTGINQGNQSLIADELDYTVRFQNTGNDTAFTVVIRDTLDKKFDINTLEIIATSHPAEIRFSQQGALEFRFEDILLPDSTTNEPASHGFVRYRVKAKQELTPPIEVENTAFIYFDQNQPIRTNTTVNELLETLVGTSELSLEKIGLSVSPNPAGQQTTVRLQIPLPELFELQVIDGAGKLIYTGTINGLNNYELAVNNWPGGNYFVKIFNDSKIGIAVFIKE